LLETKRRLSRQSEVTSQYPRRIANIPFRFHFWMTELLEANMK